MSSLIISGVSITPLDTPAATTLERLSVLPQYSRYADQVGATLALLDSCRAWLANDAAAALCHAAYSCNDAIYQSVAFASPAILADEVKRAARCDTATDMQAIAAFVLGSCLHALHAIGDCLQGVEPDEIAALALFRAYIDAISECVTTAGVRLSSEECEACNALGDIAADVSKQAAFKADGMWSGIERRGKDGTAPRDRALRLKALQLLAAGTELHNLNSKLRAWQLRETGKALTKPAMGAALQRVLPTWLTTHAFNHRKK